MQKGGKKNSLHTDRSYVFCTHSHKNEIEYNFQTRIHMHLNKRNCKAQEKKKVASIYSYSDVCEHK